MVRTYMPTMQHGDWEKVGKPFYNMHKHGFGVKLQVVAATQRRPIPLHCSAHPGGKHDLTIARQSVFHEVAPGERGLGDPGYLGEPSKVYAPPRSNMHMYDRELDKSELGLQRRIEMLNKHLKQFKVLGTIYRKGAVRAFDDLKIISVVVAQLVFLDMCVAQEYSGDVHTSGPIPNPVQKVRPVGVTGAGARLRVVARIKQQKVRQAAAQQSRRRLVRASLRVSRRLK